MDVCIDEAGRDDEATGIQRVDTINRLTGDDRNSTIIDADIADTVKVRLQIHDATIQDDDIVGILSITVAASGKRRKNSEYHYRANCCQPRRLSATALFLRRHFLRSSRRGHARYPLRACCEP